MFRNRHDAGTLLASRLKKYRNDPCIILAVPRGGIPVACAVAAELNFPLEIVFTKKIGHPHNKEYAIGAASLHDYFVVPHDNVSNEYIQNEVQLTQALLSEMHKHYMGDKEPASLAGKTLIIIDDGIATGNTFLGIIHVIQKSKPGKIIIAVPIASRSAVKILSKEVDEVVAIIIPELFYGIGDYYEDFSQVSDEEVMLNLENLPKEQRPVEA